MTEIISNGSDTLDELLEVLREYPLDRTFEDFGNFVMRESESTVHFWGNFATVSHVFSIRTDDAATIAQLETAIRANQQRADYLSQHKPKAGRSERRKR